MALFEGYERRIDKINGVLKEYGISYRQVDLLPDGSFDYENIKKAINENGESLFLQNLLNDSELREKLDENAIKECFDYSYYTKNVDAIFKRVFEI
mgnify:CR=1 FL=1